MGRSRLARFLPRRLLARFAGHALGRMAPDSAIPWHRVLRSDGRIAFPPGSPGFETQRERLMDEGVIVRNGRVSMRRYRVSDAGASA
ncbi:MGMT family protein [Tamilnaduibacter salinus]|uniref:MGMT family protein n=1 Tax=Tamilnaduibacter salinus TaxID=1484056 RepID=UPI001B80117A